MSIFGKEVKHIMKNILIGFASASLIATLAAPAVFAATDVTVQGNGDSSISTVTVDIPSTPAPTIDQHSATFNGSIVVAVAGSGGNSISGSTGAGDNTIDTGKAAAISANVVIGGSNTAADPGCGCTVDPTTVTIKGNGNKSINTVTVDPPTKSGPSVDQGTITGNLSLVGAVAGTGGNKIKGSTGKATNKVTTGKVLSVSANVVIGGSNKVVK
jgi:hypothetical protein